MKLKLIIIFQLVFFNFCFADSFFHESEREIPVIDEVDVLVVGGSSSGVAVAAAAAQNGAEVFLVAERPYLGADICRTREFWFQQSPKTDMSKRVFKTDHLNLKAADFDYSSNVKASKKHSDTPQPSKLNDGIFGNAAKDSVQYNQDVSVDIDLKGIKKVKKVCLHAFQRKDDFAVSDYELLSKIDEGEWQKQDIVINEYLKEEVDRIQMCYDEPFEARYLKLKVEKEASRILLGEIVVETEESISLKTIKTVRPFDIKYNLDKLLMDTGVTFLYGCYPTEVLKNDSGGLCGVVVTNRAGRQAILADNIIDTSFNAVVARLAGAEFKNFSNRKQFERVVIGGKYINTEIDYEKLPQLVEGKYEAVRYSLDIEINSDTFSEYCRAEQLARDRTWSPGQVDASDRLIYSPRKVKTKKDGDFGGLLAKGFNNLYILGKSGSSQQPDNTVGLFEFSERFGKYLSGFAGKKSDGKKISNFKVTNGVHLNGTGNLITGDIKEFLNGPRSFDQNYKTISSDQLALPVIEGYDVVIIGGGTSGVPAGIAASRHGAKTLVIEYLDGLGGVGTEGLIGRYCLGIRKGFTEQVDRGMADLGGYEYVIDNEGLGTPWDIELKKEWYRRELRKNDCDIWFGSIGCGALLKDGVVKGSVVATPYGRVVVKADVVIDSTGNSDIAAAAGVDTFYTDANTVEIQGTGLPPKRLGARYTNTDYSFVDESDIMDVWRMHVSAKEKFRNSKKFKGSYDIGQLIDTRERRRIKGRFVISPVDIYNKRTYSDTIVRAYSNFDTHGYAIHPMFKIVSPEHGDFIYANVPYRCMLPKGLEGIIVTGLGMSAHRDAMPVLRMQADLQNQGYAAGVAASLAVKNSIMPGDIDIAKVQKAMIEIGLLSKDVLSQKDNFPVSDFKLKRAVAEAANNYEGVEIFFTDPSRSIEFLKQAYVDTFSEEARVIYAHILAILGDDFGIDALVNKIASMAWDEGWNFTDRGGQFKSTFSRLDNFIIAAGYTKSNKAVDIIIEKAMQLDTESDFSHFCALASACENIGNKRFAPVLYEILKKEGVSGYALKDKSNLYEYYDKYGGAKKLRNFNFREILLARSLYLCGDYKGLGEKILKEYSQDFRGNYARCATFVLDGYK